MSPYWLPDLHQPSFFLFQPSVIITPNQAIWKERMASQNNQRYLKRNTLPPIVFAEWDSNSHDTGEPFIPHQKTWNRQSGTGRNKNRLTIVQHMIFWWSNNTPTLSVLLPYYSEPESCNWLVSYWNKFNNIHISLKLQHKVSISTSAI